MPTSLKVSASFIVGGVLGATLLFLLSKGQDGNKQPFESEKKPSYWVAPMDSNYRRDKPGKSPMGMDLIPVYEENSASDHWGSGVVKVAPHVINNLGVRIEPVEVKSMNTEISTVGYVQYDEDKLVHIHPRVEGWIETLYVKAAGNPVTRGQPLYKLYSPQLVNAQEEFLIALKRNNQTLIKAAQERLESLELDKEFIQDLSKSRTVSQSVTFRAPQSGVVDGLKVREGFFVKPGNTLMSIGQLERVWVEAAIFERDAALVDTGLPVSMHLDYLPGRQWNGVVDYVYPTLDPTMRTLRVRMKFDNTDLQLKPNMFAQVIIHANKIEHALTVPKESVIRTGQQDRVVVDLGGGQFKSIAVTLGRVDHHSIEILKGLRKNDRVVTSAQFLIDSESSKDSDFKRMETIDPLSSFWMKGIVNRIQLDERVIKVIHEAIEDWGRPKMTMDFQVSSSVDFSLIKLNRDLHFEATKNDDGQFEIISIRLEDEKFKDEHLEQEKKRRDNQRRDNHSAKGEQDND